MVCTGKSILLNRTGAFFKFEFKKLFKSCTSSLKQTLVLNNGNCGQGYTK